MSDIRILREPTVYLVGRQSTDAAEIDRFLADHDVATWTTDTAVAGQKLTEVAGRVCYMSFAKPRPPGNRTYLGTSSRSRPRLGARACRLQLRLHRHQPLADARTLSVTGRVSATHPTLAATTLSRSVAEYVEPDAIAADPELYRLWLDAVLRHLPQAYIRLTEGLPKKFESEPDKTARRTVSSSRPVDLYRTRPETKIFVTANARASCPLHRDARQPLRRDRDPQAGRRGAEGDADRGSNLFGDYRHDQLGDGTYEATTSVQEGVTPMQRTLLLFKPDCIQRPLGRRRSWSKLRAEGLRLVGLKLVHPTRALAEKHYAVHKARPFYESLLSFLTGGPTIALGVGGPRAVAVARTA